MYRLEYKSSVKKDLKKFDKKIKDFLKEEINSLCEGLDGKDIQPLKGSDFEGLYRFRTGDYRIIFELLDNILVISVIKVGHHRDIYKKIKR